MLANDPKGYDRWYDETKEVLTKNQQLFDAMATKYRAAAGEDIEYGSNDFSSVDSESSGNLLQEDSAASFKREKYMLTEDPQRPAYMEALPIPDNGREKSKEYPQTPTELLQTLTVNYKFRSPEKRPRNVLTVVSGIGFAALQHKDFKLGVKALSFLKQEKGEIPRSLLLKIRKLTVSRLTFGERQDYLQACEDAGIEPF